VDNAGLLRDFAGNQRLPTLQLFGDVGVVGLDSEFGDSVDSLDDGDYNSWEVGLRFEVPIPNRTARSAYEIARHDHARAVTRQADLLEAITRDVADALGDLRTAQGRIVTARDSRDLAAEVLALRDRSFQLGRLTDNLEVLRAQETLANAERDLTRAEVDHAIALANLYRAQGVLLDRRGIAFVSRQKTP
jgi:outer membrane protein TolC